MHYNNDGYEAVYNPGSDTCEVTVRGYSKPDGSFVRRGGPAHPDDKPILRISLDTSCAKLAGVADCVPKAVRETFHDVLWDRRDLLGAPLFRNKPADDAERRLFAAAYDAAQKVRSSSTILGVDKLAFATEPPLFDTVDCFCRDKSGAFWLMLCDAGDAKDCDIGRRLSLAAYVLEAGEYVPTNAAVRLGVWRLAPNGCRFAEVVNDRIAARDAVIRHLLTPPF